MSTYISKQWTVPVKYWDEDAEDWQIRYETRPVMVPAEIPCYLGVHAPLNISAAEAYANDEVSIYIPHEVFPSGRIEMYDLSWDVRRNSRDTWVLVGAILISPNQMVST